MRVLFFGKIRDRAGEARELDTTGLATVADVTTALCADAEIAAALAATSYITILDDEVVKPDAPIGTARELAFLPPVSGG